MNRIDPARMSLSNLSTSQSVIQTLEAQFNPTQLRETIVVNYARLAVLGLSHKPLQYQNTDNHTFPIELAFRAYDAKGNRLDDNKAARRFLMSLCYPRRGSSTVTGGAPPRLLFVWPGLMSLVAVITKLEFEHTLFNFLGDPVHSSAKIDLEEIRDVRLFSEDVLAQGTLRSGNLAPGA
jgi:hypothetical protein